jgi:hypothetical protein
LKPGATEADSAFIRTAFLVNSPQVILSLVYFAYNGAFTKFLLADELNGYGIERKGLRVSAERIGAQRVTYFLQLPYRYALPLMITSGLLHWMSSQAFFLVDLWITKPLQGNIRLEDWYEKTQNVEMVTGCYSPSAILCIVFVVLCMIAFVGGFGSKKFKCCMPIWDSSSSLDISALCHPPSSEDGHKTAILKVQCGFTSTTSPNQNNLSVNSYTFSSLPTKNAELQVDEV